MTIILGNEPNFFHLCCSFPSPGEVITSGQRLKPEMLKCPPSRAPVHTFHATPGVMMLF